MQFHDQPKPKIQLFASLSVCAHIIIEVQIKIPSNYHGGFQHSTHVHSTAVHFELQQVYICSHTRLLLANPFMILIIRLWYA